MRATGIGRINAGRPRNPFFHNSSDTSTLLFPVRQGNNCMLHTLSPLRMHGSYRRSAERGHLCTPQKRLQLSVSRISSNQDTLPATHSPVISKNRNTSWTSLSFVALNTHLQASAVHLSSGLKTLQLGLCPALSQLKSLTWLHWSDSRPSKSTTSLSAKDQQSSEFDGTETICYVTYQVAR